MVCMSIGTIQGTSYVTITNFMVFIYIGIIQAASYDMLFSFRDKFLDLCDIYHIFAANVKSFHCFSAHTGLHNAVQLQARPRTDL